MISHLFVVCDSESELLLSLLLNTTSACHFLQCPVCILADKIYDTKCVEKQYNESVEYSFLQSFHLEVL